MLTLTTATGASLSLTLHDGGSYARNNALNRDHAPQDHFLLASERDVAPRRRSAWPSAS